MSECKHQNRTRIIYEDDALIERVRSLEVCKDCGRLLLGEPKWSDLYTFDDQRKRCK